jgi:beta-glucanase (GH16 family)
MGLIGSSSASARFGVDSSNVYPENARGRASVRLESFSTYNGGLFVFDIQHMPGQVCGIWPALWTLGSGLWPQNGEIGQFFSIYGQTALTLFSWQT